MDKFILLILILFIISNIYFKKEGFKCNQKGESKSIPISANFFPEKCCNKLGRKYTVVHNRATNIKTCCFNKCIQKNFDDIDNECCCLLRRGQKASGMDWFSKGIKWMPKIKKCCAKCPNDVTKIKTKCCCLQLGKDFVWRYGACHYGGTGRYSHHRIN